MASTPEIIRLFLNECSALQVCLDLTCVRKSSFVFLQLLSSLHQGTNSILGKLAMNVWFEGLLSLRLNTKVSSAFGLQSCVISEA